jgi:hypothetical protein
MVGDEEVTEAIVEPLDVRQHAHGRMVRKAAEGVCAVARQRGHCMGISLRSRQKFSSDARRKPVDTERMNDEALKRAALVTLRRAICERFPPGPERRAWLRWAQSRADVSPRPRAINACASGHTSGSASSRQR